MLESLFFVNYAECAAADFDSFYNYLLIREKKKEKK